MKFDAIVIGGGPGGSACAETLAKNNIDVILFEKAGDDRYKPCAGGLMWHNEVDFGPLPSSLIERDVEHIILAGPTRSVDLKDANGSKRIGQLTYRTRLDRYLRDLAAKSGATVETNSEVIDVSIHKDHVEAEIRNGSSTKTVKGEVLVVATGARTTQIQRKLKMDRPTDFQMAINAEFSLPSSIIEDRFGGGVYALYFDSQLASHGYTWIFTKKEGLSVGMCDKAVNINRFSEIIAHHPEISKKIEGAKPIKFDGKHIWAAPIPDRIPEHIYRDRVVLVGDAAGFSDRYTYEGIWHARFSGKTAAEVLVRAKKRDDYTATYLQKYQIRAHKIFRVIQNSQRTHHLIYHSGYMDLITDTIVEILQDPSLSQIAYTNIQILLEGFLDPGDDAASISAIIQEKLLERLREKLDRNLFKKVNRELEFAFAIA